jgi:hypothetical protein
MSRDLDAAIAEKLFGWKHILRAPAATVGENSSLWHGISPEERGGYVPHYSSDIGAAWSVVEHMQSLGWHYEIFDFDDLTEVVFHHDQVDGPASRRAATVTEAICLAAIAALENTQ